MDYQKICAGIKNVYIYTRVSTKNQVGTNDEYNVGIETQNFICRDYYTEKLEDIISENEDSNPVPTYVQEVGSSFNNEDKLVELTRLIESLPMRSVILISEITRLGRNIYQVIEKVYKPVERKKSLIISVNDEKVFGYNRSDDLYFFQKTIQAESQSIDRSIDSKKRAEIAKRRGSYVGGIPYGMKLKRDNRNKIHKLVRDPKQGAIIRKIIGYYSRGSTPKQIAQILENDPRNKYRGKPITKSLVARIIKNFKKEQNELIDGVSNVTI